MHAFDKQLNQIASSLIKLEKRATTEADNARFSHDRRERLGEARAFAEAYSLIKPLISNPILMTFDHKEGFRLEELLHTLVEEIKVKDENIKHSQLEEADKLIYQTTNMVVLEILPLLSQLQDVAIKLVHEKRDSEESKIVQGEGKIYNPLYYAEFVALVACLTHDYTGIRAEHLDRSGREILNILEDKKFKKMADSHASGGPINSKES